MAFVFFKSCVVCPFWVMARISGQPVVQTSGFKNCLDNRTDSVFNAAEISKLWSCVLNSTCEWVQVRSMVTLQRLFFPMLCYPSISIYYLTTTNCWHLLPGIFHLLSMYVDVGFTSTEPTMYFLWSLPCKYLPLVALKPIYHCKLIVMV